MTMTSLPPAPSRANPTDFAAKGDAFLLALQGFCTEANALQADVTAKQAATAGYAAQRDATGGYPGLTLFKINFKNALNTFMSFFTNANTAARTYTFQDKTGTIADLADVALKANLSSPTLTGVPAVPTAVDGTNTTQIASTAFVQSAIGGYLAVAVTSGTATVTLTDAEASNPVISVTGVLTANVSVVLPATTKRLWAIYNATTGAFTVTVKLASGTGVAVAQGKRNLVYTDGVNMYDGFNDFESVSLTGVPTAPTAAVGNNTTQIATTAFVAAQRDTTGGYPGLTLFKINFKNALNTFTSFFTNANTAARTYTFQDRTGTIADLADVALKANSASPALTGVPTAPTAMPGTATQQIATTAFVAAFSNTGLAELTLLAVTNVATISAGDCLYSGTTSLTTMFGEFVLTPSAIGAGALLIGLPIPAAMVDTRYAKGVATSDAGDVGIIYADTVSDKLRMDFKASTVLAKKWRFSACYIVV